MKGVVNKVQFQTFLKSTVIGSSIQNIKHANSLQKELDNTIFLQYGMVDPLFVDFIKKQTKNQNRGFSKAQIIKKFKKYKDTPEAKKILQKVFKKKEAQIKKFYSNNQKIIDNIWGKTSYSIKDIVTDIYKFKQSTNLFLLIQSLKISGQIFFCISSVVLMHAGFLSGPALHCAIAIGLICFLLANFLKGCSSIKKIVSLKTLKNIDNVVKSTVYKVFTDDGIYKVASQWLKRNSVLFRSISSVFYSYIATDQVGNL